MMKTRLGWLLAATLLVTVPLLAACAGPTGPAGPIGPAGSAGPAGATGPQGAAGVGVTPPPPPPAPKALTAETPTAAYPTGVQLKLEGLADEFRIKYSITLVNATDKDLSNIVITTPLPSASRFYELTTIPVGAALKDKPGTSVVWTLDKLAARTSIGPFEYKVSVSDREAGPASAAVEWQQPTAGSAAASALNFEKIAINLPKRGCPACHALRDEKTGAVTIAYEAKVRGGPNHVVYPWDTKVTTCLQCHAPGTGERANMGVVAPKMLRDIVHPVHLNSPSFIGIYKGNCFTCHNVDGKGTFTLLEEKLRTDFRGIPAEVPVKGIPPSAR